MPEVKNINDAAIAFVYTEIGRGHPTYLDGIIDTLRRNYPDIPFFRSDAFSISRHLSRWAWVGVRSMYRIGGRGGLITSLYGGIRRRAGSRKGRGVLDAVLGHHIKSFMGKYRNPIVVAHPLLAKILVGQNRVIYQHGEMAAPSEAVVNGCLKTLIPLSETADRFMKAGIPQDKIAVTGHCIETDLEPIVNTAFPGRLARLKGRAPLTAALFSSGAYPTDHLNKLILLAGSLSRADHDVIFFAGTNRKKTASIINRLKRKGIATSTELNGSSGIKVIYSANRREENKNVAAVFDKLDFFAAPAHERTNWAVALGLPQLILRPHIGSYAPLNAEIALKRETAYEIADENSVREVSDIISQLRRSGRLAQMAENGFDRKRRNGFSRGTEILVELINWK